MDSLGESVFDKEWEKEAKALLVSLIARRGKRYKELAALLQLIGVTETERSIACKIQRGNFSFTFFMQCMYVLQIKSVDLTPLPPLEKKN